jgi:protoheme IX farnesyltransferase
LVLATTGLGFLLASPGPVAWLRLVGTILGTALVGGGANGFNQWREADPDARMHRTRMRPLPSRKISPRAGFAFSAFLTAIGAALLFTQVNALTAGLALASWALYVFVYTPLKSRTTLNTIVGAISGAIPPLMGWTGARGTIDAGGLVLFAILFVWQIPHFLAIAWVYRGDYAEGGFRMLPVVDPAGHSTFRIVLVYCLGLLPVSFAAAFVGLAGWLYLVGAALLGLGMLWNGARLYRERTEEAATRLFVTSLIYLPILFVVMLLDPTRLR